MADFIKSKARPEIFTLKPYIPGKPIEEVKRELGLDDIIKLASNENPLGPSPLAMEALAGFLGKLHIYPDSNCFDLKRRIASLWDIETTSILMGNGSDEVLKLLAETFINHDDQIIYAQPSFSAYEFVARIMGAECVEVSLSNFTHDLEAIHNAVTNRTKIIIICNPNNPTGTIVDESELDAFVDKIPEDILLVFDEAYSEYVESPNFVSGLKYLKQGRNVVVLRTFSKIFGLASLRIGYGLTTPSIAAAVERVKEPFNVNMPAQIAALAALDDKEHIQSSQQTNSQGKKYLYDEFKKMGLSYVPTEANFIFLDTGKDCQQVFNDLLSMGVIIRTGDIFGYPNFIRVTVGTFQDNERFIKSLKKVLAK